MVKQVNRLIKKYLLLIFLYLFSHVKLLAQQGIDNLFEYALLNNPQILSAKNDYENAIRISILGGDAFVPEIVVSSTGALENFYSTSVTYKQPFIGGIEFSASDIFYYQSKIHQISFSLTQSLFPFWVQGVEKDTKILSYSLLVEYYYNQMLYVQQEIFQELVKNYVNAFLENNKIQSIKNSIKLVQAQIETLFDLKQTGAINIVELNNLENSNLSYCQELLSVESSYLTYIQKLESLCGIDLDEDALFSKQDIISYFETVCHTHYELAKLDACGTSLQLKIKLAENKIIEIKQNNAPALEMSAGIPVYINSKHTGDWTFGLSFDLSPLFSGIAVSNKKFAESELEVARKEYYFYVEQRKSLRYQYNFMIEKYKEQIRLTKKLLNQFEEHLEDLRILFSKGSITYLELQSEETQFNNLYLAYEDLYIYLWLYNILEMFVKD